MFKISEFSKLGQVSVKTLRYYDKLELLKPAYIDSDTGYRYYTADQLFLLNRILAFKELGFTLNQIRLLLEEEIPVEQIRGMFRLKQAEIHTLLENELGRLKRIEERLYQIEKEGSIEAEHEVVIKKLEAQHFASLRKPAAIQEIPQLFAQLDRDLGKNFSSSYPQTVLWHCCEECEGEVDLEVCYPLQQISMKSEVQVQQLPEAPMAATLLHRCHPASPCTASAELGIWIEQNGYQIKENEPRREVFLHPEHDFYIAEVQIPIEKVPSNVR
ncbi:MULTISPECIES: MerR family transcriptional regulator [Bacillus]|uniref:Transcriptional regulator n=2 Tax=Bacillus TaxID=1386 RepID=A0A0M4FNQ4_9BACI|nr:MULTISPECIES: helix-turn-helix domain-containing protein [Bacillus]ALC84317.1 transcriptional regulator [Bacillus gobiensis]MBP1082332.1 DNA-binding transcriptional MerR regulator [Bacillus capparidis]MED1097409.1 helix-turn-helix domain-containing protein [Bacillus capparidis]